MLCTPPTPAVRRYNVRFIASMLVYAALILLTVWTFKHRPPTGVLAWLLAILPSLPIVGGLVAAGLYLVEEKDEIQRTIFVESMLWSIGATLTVTTVWGFLENFLHVPHFDLYLVFPLFWFVVGVSTPLLKARYR
jgi:hypothetical protein